MANGVGVYFYLISFWTWVRTSHEPLAVKLNFKSFKSMWDHFFVSCGDQNLQANNCNIE